MTDEYITDEAEGGGWKVLLGDSCERLAELDDDSIDFTIYSPPFSSLFTYSPSERDLGNSTDQTQFLQHYGFIVRELLRVVKPGRLVAVHCQQVTLQKAKDGYMGMTDFRGDLIRAHMDAGFIFHGEVTVDKDPQAQAIRTKAHALMFVSLKRDGVNVRPALADYVLIFRVPGENEVPVITDVDNETWIEWARPIWTGIRETATLNTAVAKENADERHICPLQLPLIHRCVRLWTNKGETVLSPFAGIGSEGYESVRLGRQFVGIELKPSYWATAVTNLEEAERIRDEATLFPAEIAAG